jgi:hypothetical protein
LVRIVLQALKSTMYTLLATAVTLVFSAAMAIPAVALPHENTFSKRQGLGVVTTVTNLTNAEIASFVPFAEFARAAYCNITTGTDCGIACEANPGFDVTLYGGDGNDIQYC